MKKAGIKSDARILSNPLWTSERLAIANENADCSEKPIPNRGGWIMAAMKNPKLQLSNAALEARERAAIMASLPDGRLAQPAPRPSEMNEADARAKALAEARMEENRAAFRALGDAAESRLYDRLLSEANGHAAFFKEAHARKSYYYQIKILELWQQEQSPRAEMR